MKATILLMSEHRVIEQVLLALECGAGYLIKGGNIRPGFFAGVTDFIQGFADSCHHSKEEAVLFKAMVANGVPEGHGPVGVMLNEHEEGRKYTRAMQLAVQKMTADPSAREVMIENALGYASLLRQHIMEEDHILFPMADRFIPSDHHERIMDNFGRVELETACNGSHEKYLILAGTLFQEAMKLV